MSFEELNDPRSSEIGNNQIQLTELATYEERTPGHELTNNDMKRGQETNHIRKQEAGTQDTHDRGLTVCL